MATSKLVPNSPASEPLAIVGFAFKFPSGIESTEAFWEMMLKGDTGLSEIPEDRINLTAFLDIYGGKSSKDGECSKPKGYFLQGDIGAFDAPFFSITAEEAVAMDPQQRLLLETSYQAIENAGMTLKSINGSKTSVHVGCLSQDYRLAGARDPEIAAKYSATGTELSILANRLSWFFNLKGPSLSVETACSSSLVALDLGCQLLRNRETDMALVAGTSLMSMPDFYIYLDNMGFLSPDHRCHSFDARANGYARSEGLGVLIIKRLSDAIRDNNMIRAVIRASGSNSDGYTPGITQPSGISQLTLIRETYQKVGLSMEPTMFCEAHGTGTLLGDPIECHAIGAAFRSTHNSSQPLYLGASKANIGHMEAASGIAGVIKTVLTLERGIIPPIADLVDINPNIDASYYRLKFPTEATAWPKRGLRRASVNSFGFGGTNAHVVIDDAYHFMTENGLMGNHNTSIEPKIPFDETSPRELQDEEVVVEKPQILMLSTADRDGIKRIGKIYSEYFEKVVRNATLTHSSRLFQRFVSTLNRRALLPWSSYAIVDSLQSLQHIDETLSIPKRPATNPSLAFVFTGQGAQWPRMGVELMAYPVFAQSITESNEYLTKLGCSWDLEEEINREAADSRIHDPALSQPISCALQVALVDLLEHIKIEPAIVLGHSSGEVAAAYCKGAISHESAIKIAYFRGMGGSAASNDPTKNGTMMSVGLGEKEISPILQEMSSQGFNDLYIACINSPGNVSIAGEVSHIDQLKIRLVEKNIFARKLKVSCAYHSPHMISVAKEYFSRAGTLAPGHNIKDIVMLSYLDGHEVSNKRLLDLDYWITNMCAPVHFTKSISGIDDLGSIAMGPKKLDLSHKKGILITNILEVGPHSALKGPIRDILGTFRFVENIKYDSVLVRGTSPVKSLLDAAGSLLSSGFELDIPTLNMEEGLAPIADLPGYPFSHSRSYWKESQRSKNERLRYNRPNELLGSRTPDWHPLSATWRNFLSESKSDWIKDHKINNVVLYPGAGMIAMALEAINQYTQDSLKVTPTAFRLKDVQFIAAMNLPAGLTELETQINLKPLGEGGSLDISCWFEFNIFSCQNGQWKKNCKGRIRAELHDTHAKSLQEFIKNVTIHGLPTEQFFNTIQKAGYAYGSAFQRITQLRYSTPREIQAEVEIYKPETEDYQGHGYRAIDRRHVIHPTTLDAFFQIPLASVALETSNMPTIIPVKVKNMWLSSTGLNSSNSLSLAVQSRLDFYGYRGGESSLFGADSKGRLAIEIEGYEMARTSGGEDDYSRDISVNDLHHCWNPIWQSIPPLKPKGSGSVDMSKKRQILVEIHVQNQTSTTQVLSNALKSRLEILGCGLTTAIVDSKQTSPTLNHHQATDLKIVLWDLDRESILANPTKEKFSAVQNLVKTNNHILWIQNADVCSHHLVDGFSRVLRQENHMTGFATLSIDSTRLEDRVEAISNVSQILLSEEAHESPNLPQTFRATPKGLEYLCLKEATELTKKIQSASSLARSLSLTPWDTKTPMKITVGSPGMLDTIHFIDDPQAEEPLAEDNVEVEVRAVGLNFKDCLIALGALNENSIGQELAGVVTRVGAGRNHGFVPGDRVCGFSRDGYRTVYRNKAQNFSKISASMSFSVAASIPINFATAWYSLRYVAQLRRGETVLIHSGAGGTGQAAIQIAQHLGAIVYTTVGTDEKRKMLTEVYGIPSENIFSSRDSSSFAQNIRSISNGKGVDVVLNSLSGDMLFASWEAIAPFGRFVEIGKKDIQSQNGLPMAQFEKNCSFSAVDLGHMFAERPEMVTKLIDEVLARFEKGSFTAVQPVKVFRISDIVDAFRLMQSGKSTGKIVIEMGATDQVQATLKPKPKPIFIPNGSYIIAGGLGGLGRDIARWMAERGAKTIVLLSRSGPTESARDFLTTMRDMGVNCLTPRCDISDMNSVQETIKQLQITIPPIKGCIQATMVLKSALFNEMDQKQWSEALASKVLGSWNLHLSLPKILDFFVLLSSVQGVIGARTQSNYASANTYMDALAQYRVKQGLKSISLQLGVMNSDGYLAEHRDEKDLLLSQNTYLPVERSDFHALLNHYCDKDLPLLSPDNAQVTVGLKLLYSDPAHDLPGTSWASTPMFQNLRRLTPLEEANTSQDNVSRFTVAKSEKEATEILLKALTHRLASTIGGIEPDEVDQSKPVQAYGVDSLQTMELRSWFLKCFKSDVPTFEILGAANLTALANAILQRSFFKAAILK
ncbi:hypothetical protein TWF694_011109 [Orbilia ellipsospora]|uniref:Polyketide synthase n=1 Tax=Orbilia ellipsospora TaxID=2528407 RepID=A0AAV9X974_9PEZI